MTQPVPAIVGDPDTSVPDAPGPDDGIDEEILAELFMVLGDGASDGLVRACDLLLTSVPARLTNLDAALAEDRFGDAVAVAHSLRGSTGAFGARRLSALADRLEHVCGDADRGSATLLVEAMRAEFGVFRTILAARLAGIAP